MKGYVFVDYEGNLNIKNIEYIDNENPNFWKENAGLVEKWWKFDTEEKSSMRMVLLQLKDYGIKPQVIVEFRDQIGVPIKSRKKEE